MPKETQSDQPFTNVSVKAKPTDGMAVNNRKMPSLEGSNSACKCTYSSGKSELKVVGAESVIFDGSSDDFVQELGFAEDVLRDTKPKTEKLLSIAN